MAGYTRQDTGNNIENSEIIDATYLDQEFDAIAAAFHASTGHKHDGTATEGAPITVVGPAQDFIATAALLRGKTTNVYDLGSGTHKFKDAYFDGVVNSDAFVGTSANSFRGLDADTAADPSFTWAADLDTGMFNSAANVIGFSTDGTERMTIGATGIVAIVGAATIGGTLAVTGAITGAVTGNASTATALATARTIALSGAATGTATSFNGTANITIPVTALNASNLSAGTVPSARIAGAYTAFTSITASGAISGGSITGTTGQLGNFQFSGIDIFHTADNSALRISGGDSSSDGAHVEIYGPTNPSTPNQIISDATSHVFRSQNGLTSFASISSSGINLVGNFTTTGIFDNSNITIDGLNIYNSSANDETIKISGGNGPDEGAAIRIIGATHATNPAEVIIDATNHRFRSAGSSTLFANLSSSALTLGTNIALEFAGTGADTTRTNLGLGTAATLSVGSGSGNIRNNAANEAFFLEVASNLSDVASVPSARNNLGLGTLATQDEGTGSANFRDNLANDSRFHVKGVDTLDTDDLPTDSSADTWVRARIAESVGNSLGTYALAYRSSTAEVVFGQEVAGTTLQSSSTLVGDGSTLSGTWKCMGYIPNSETNAHRITLWLKVGS